MSNRKKVLVLAACTMATLMALDGYSRASARAEAAADKSARKQKSAETKPEKTKKPILIKFMRRKLTASSQVLEGLCTEDFDLLEKGAKGLQKLSSAEAWRVSNDAMYRQHSLEFRTGVDALLKAAKNKKLDSAALAWTKTTLNCIECHRWMKGRLISEK